MSGDDLLRDVRDRVGRYSESDARIRLRVRVDLVVQTEDVSARVEQGTARVTGVDRRVGLDRTGDRVLVGRLDAAVDGADDSRGHRPREPERAADRHDV